MRSRTLVGFMLVLFVLSMIPVMATAVQDPIDPVWGEAALVDEAGDQREPSIDGGVAVWTEWVSSSSEIHLYDFSTDTTSVVVAGGDSYRPDIFENTVVWEDYSVDSDGNVYSKDLSTGVISEVATGTGEQYNAAVSGDIVVYQDGSHLTEYDISMADLSTGVTQTVCDAANDQENPDVSGDVIIWEDWRIGTDADIYMYDTSTATESAVCTDTTRQQEPAISGDIVVWEDSRNIIGPGTGVDIYMKNLSTGEESAVCTATGHQEVPAIYGDVIVWEDARNGAGWDVYAYDISTGEEWEVTTATGDQDQVATDGSHVLWRDARNHGVSGDDIWWAGYDTVAPTTASDAKASYTGSATFTLTATDNPFGSGIEKTYYKVDYVGAWYDGPFTVYRPGKHVLHYKSYDNVGNLEAYNVKYFDLISTDTTYTAIEGPTRYDTAVAASKKAFPKGAGCVVIATGVNWPDALGGAALAKAKGGPILLTMPSVLPDAVMAEIGRLGASEAVILGGIGAVSQDVENALIDELGADKVSRINGATRYETADEVAKAVAEECGCAPAKVLVTTGRNFPDALGASPLAALGPWPIVLSQPAGLTEGTKATIEEIGFKYGVILGGEGAVTPEAETDLVDLLTADKVERLAGATRYDTAIECARFGVDHGLFWDGVAISTGRNFPDALAGGILQGEAGSVLLLTSSTSLHPSVAAELAAQRDWIGNVTYLGGTGAVSLDVRNEVAQVLK